MNNYHIELSIVAFTQLKTIGDYITYVLLEPDTSRRLIRALRSSISNLSTFPYRYPPLIRHLHSRHIHMVIISHNQL